MTTTEKDKYWLLAKAIGYQQAALTHPEMQQFADRFWDAADLFNRGTDYDYNVIFGAINDYIQMVMRDDEPALIVCCQELADFLCGKEPGIVDALVITNLVPPGEVYVIPQQEFMDYLEEKGELEL